MSVSAHITVITKIAIIIVCNECKSYSAYDIFVITKIAIIIVCNECKSYSAYDIFVRHRWGVGHSHPPDVTDVMEKKSE